MQAQRNKNKIASLAVLLVLCMIAFLSIEVSQASAHESEQNKAIITLEGVFSMNGAATEFAMNYGGVIAVPNATAEYDGEKIPVVLTVLYLGGSGWREYLLPDSRILVIGDVDGVDKNRTAIYKVIYSAGEGNAKTELTYTIYAGLEMFVTTDNEITAFVGEPLYLPRCMPTYKYKTYSGIEYINVVASEQIVFYEEGSAEGEVVTTTDTTITPERAGKYVLTFSSPNKIEQNAEVFVGDGVTVSVAITVRQQRDNPATGKDGMYQTGYAIGGTSDIGKGMVGSSCKRDIQIEKRSETYRLYFTVTSAQIMDNLVIAQSGSVFDTEVTDIYYQGADLIQTTIVTLTKEQLQKSLDFSMRIVPMERDVSFSVAADLENAYLLEEYEPPVSLNNETPGGGLPWQSVLIIVAICVATLSVAALSVVIIWRKKYGK